jgi:hypothetical protein
MQPPDRAARSNVTCSKRLLIEDARVRVGVDVTISSLWYARDIVQV